MSAPPLRDGLGVAGAQRSNPPSAPQQRGRPGSPRTLGIAGELAAAVLLFVLIDVLVFRSGLYLSILAPESYAGQVQRLVASERERPVSGVRELLLLGDSRMAEGFSAKRADQALGAGGFKFINGSVPGSTLRTEYYLLRELDPTAQRYAGIVIGLEDYDDLAGPENLADRGLDLAFVSPLLRYADVFDFAWTFESPQNRTVAAFDSILRGFAFRLDAQDLLADPLKRVRDVRAYQVAGNVSLYNYAGHAGSLAGLRYDASGSYVFPSGLSNTVRDELTSELQTRRAQPFPSTRYRQDWLKRILASYRDSETQFIFVQMPRGPIVVPNPTHTGSFQTIDWLASMPHTYVMPAESFAFLEHPDLFFDALHLNVQGREQFTDALSRTLATRLEGVPATISAPASAWEGTLQSGWRFNFTVASQEAAYVSGLYERDAGLTFVQPDFSLRLPAPRPTGILRMRAYLPPEFERLLPLTISIEGLTGQMQSSTIAAPGPFTLDVPVGASAATERLVFHIDKSLVPRAIRLNQDERPLSIGLLAVDFIPEATSQ